MSNLQAQNLFQIHDDLVAVITGGGTGLGLMMARTLIHNGAKAVYLLGPSVSELDSAIQSFSDPLRNKLIGCVCDVTSKTALNDAVATIKSGHGYINLLVNNAGVPGPQQPGYALAAAAASGKLPTPSEYAKIFYEPDMQDFGNAFEINTTGAFYTTLAFLPLLEEGNKRFPPGVSGTPSLKSHVLFTSSASAITRTFADKVPAYAASKAATLHLMKNMSTYSAQCGWRIRMNAFLPSWFATAATAGLPWTHGRDGKKPHEEGGVTKDVSPAERVLGEEDVAGAVLYLCSKAGDLVDGCVLIVDGGRVGVVPATY